MRRSGLDSRSDQAGGPRYRSSRSEEGVGEFGGHGVAR